MNTTQAIIATLLATGLSVSVSAFAKDFTPAFAEPSAVRCCAAPAQSAQPIVEPTHVRCCARTIEMPANEEESTPPEMATRAGTPVGASRIWW